jgi:hypothetical protein
LQAAGGIGLICSVAYKTIGAKQNSDESKKQVMEIYLETEK